MPKKYYAKLIPQDNIVDDPVIKISGNKFSIGRSHENDFVIDQSGFVSNCHCYILKDIPENGKFTLYDISSNGTFINKSDKLNRDFREISSDDMISVTYYSDLPDKNLTYRFVVLGEDDNEEDEESKETEESIAQNFYKGRKITDDSENSASPSKLAKIDTLTDVTLLRNQSTSIESSTQSNNAQRGGEAGPSTVTTVSSSNSSSTTSSVDSSGCSSESKKSAADSSYADKMDSSLLCAICKDIMYCCVSIQPCLHSFCAGCLAQWSQMEKICPTCRVHIKSVAKNHLVNNLIEVYLSGHPEKARCDEEKQALDQAVQQTNIFAANYFSSNILFSASSSPTSSNSSSASSPPHNHHHQHSSVFPSFPNPNRCRQCYPPPSSVIGGALINATATHTPTQTPDNSVVVPPVMRNTPLPNCHPALPHHSCRCCRVEMARIDYSLAPPGSTDWQRCQNCRSVFCNLYAAQGCNSCVQNCLKVFDERNFDENSVPDFLNGNNFERTKLRDYLRSQNISLRQCYDYCFVQLEANAFKLTTVSVMPDSSAASASSSDTNTNMNTGTNTNANSSVITRRSPLCSRCSNLMMARLFYQYAKQVFEQLPAAQRNQRPDCYYGRNCRTQRTRFPHAAKYNHLCEQTHFPSSASALMSSASTSASSSASQH